MNKTIKDFVHIFIALAFTACTTTEQAGENIAEKLTSSRTYEIVKEKAPEGGCYIYLDASGSMPGYFTDGLNDYIKIVSGLKGYNANTKVYFWGDNNREVTNLNSTITNGNYKGSASLFQDIFRVMADKVRTDKTLTFLVTDGIVSNASNVTKKRTGYTIADLPLLHEKIKTAVGDSMAIAVFRCEIPFNGTYWDIDNKPKNIETHRPIFVFAIGYPTAVADLRFRVMSKMKEMENFISLEPIQLYMGIYREVKDKNPFRDTEGDKFVTDDSLTQVSLVGGVEDFEIAVNVPKWIVSMGADPKENGIITIVNSDGSKIDVNKHYNDGVMKFSTKDGSEFNMGEYSVNYRIAYRPSDTWNKYNCDDDRAMTSDTLCDRTFGLKDILKGFELATKQPDILLESSFKFDVNQ